MALRMTNHAVAGTRPNHSIAGTMDAAAALSLPTLGSEMIRFRPESRAIAAAFDPADGSFLLPGVVSTTPAQGIPANSSALRVNKV